MFTAVNIYLVTNINGATHAYTIKYYIYTECIIHN